MSATIRNLAGMAADLLSPLVCHVTDHSWRAEPVQNVHGRAYGPYRVCARCGTGGILTDPRPGHPESTTRDLPPEQEAQLAEIGARLFPQEAK